MSNGVTKAYAAYRARSLRERRLIAATAAVFLLLGAWTIVSAIDDQISYTRKAVISRNSDLHELSQLLSSYARLEHRLTALQETYAQSEMSLEALTQNIDTVVREAAGSGSYGLDKARDPIQLDSGYEKQVFTLNVKGLNMDQLVKLLHGLENGKDPLFLGKVSIDRADASSFTSNIEIFTIRKSSV